MCSRADISRRIGIRSFAGNAIPGNGESDCQAFRLPISINLTAQLILYRPAGGTLWQTLRIIVACSISYGGSKLIGLQEGYWDVSEIGMKENLRNPLSMSTSEQGNWTHISAF
jgi:hypothetical protein